MILLEISQFLGRLHPLIVHLPIGILFVILLFELLAYKSRYNYLRDAIPLLSWLLFASTLFAAIFGYILSLDGDYPGTLVSKHQWAGIILCLMALGMALLQSDRFQQKRRLPVVVQTSLWVVIAMLTSFTGHQGGSLTHGEDYLSLQVLREQKRPKPDSVEAALLYEDVIQPLLIRRCGQCHNEGKKKGQLSVSILAKLLKGGKTGPALVPGEPEKSELIHRIKLDPSDEKFMPTDGKTPLTAEETILLIWWVKEAGAAEGKSLTSLAVSPEIRSIVAKQLGMDEGNGVNAINETTGQLNIPTGLAIKADSTAIRQLKAAGFMVRLLLREPQLLDITLPEGTSVDWKTIQEPLAKVSKHTIWLNLAGNNLSEKELQILSQFTNLEKLRLDKNPVSDELLPLLESLQRLEAINLIGTHISKAGLARLKSAGIIKRVYYWESSSPD
jgi:uncharacterized membrane protein